MSSTCALDRAKIWLRNNYEVLGTIIGVYTFVLMLLLCFATLNPPA